MGDHILENSTEEKYLGHKIHEDGTAASIAETIKGGMECQQQTQTANRIPFSYRRTYKLIRN